MSVVARAILTGVLLGAASAAAAAPSNDLVENAYELATSQRSVYGTLHDATAHPSDPAIKGKTGIATVWYKMIKPVPGTYYVDTAGSFTPPIEVNLPPLYLSAWTTAVGSFWINRGEAAGIPINGSNVPVVSGMRIVVPPNTAQLWIAVAASANTVQVPFRLNIQRFDAEAPNPLVLTPPQVFLFGGGASNQVGEFFTRNQPLYAIYNALDPAKPTARITATTDFPQWVSVPTPPVQIGDNQGVRIAPEALFPGPYVQQPGAYSHNINVKAVNPADNAVVYGERNMPVRYMRWDVDTTTAEPFTVTLSKVSETVVLGEQLKYDLRITNPTATGAKGCMIYSVNGSPNGKVVTPDGYGVSWQLFDPVSGDLSKTRLKVFDLPAGASQKLRITLEVRRTNNLRQPIIVSCSSPWRWVGTSSFTPARLTRNESILTQYVTRKPLADARFTFDEGYEAGQKPLRYTMQQDGTKWFAVNVKNEGEARTLKLQMLGDKGGISPTMPISTKFCLDSPAAGDLCVGLPVGTLTIPMAAGETRRVLVQLTSNGTPISDVPEMNRMMIRAMDLIYPVGSAGFALSTFP